MSETPDRPRHLLMPRQTTPTWEVELLISGAVVFSLFSLREPLEQMFSQNLPVATETLQPLVVYTYLYSKVVLFVLMITFVLHLAARARWVAIVGVHSIYPEGPRWDNLSGGPLAKKLTREAMGPVEQAIERADNQASLVFGYGILAAQLALMILIVSLSVFATVAVLNALGLPDRAEIWLLSALAALLVLPMLVDKWLLGRLREGHWLSRPVELLMRISFAITLSRSQQPLSSLLTTNLGGKHGAWVLIGVLYGVIGLATVDTFVRVDRDQRLRGDALGKTSRAFGVYAPHYADQRQGILTFNSAPFIDSEIIEGPYLRLTIPYLATRHDEWLDRHCPEAAEPAEAPEDEAARRDAQQQAHQARVDCFGSHFAVQLDGQPLTGLRFFRLQRTDDLPDGVFTLIDVRELAPGHHTLRLESVDLVDLDEAEGDKEAKSPEPHVIDFWR